MIAVLALCAVRLLDGFAVGNNWCVERKYRYLNEQSSIDIGVIDQIEFRVESVTSTETKFSVKTALAGTTAGKDVVPPPTDLRAKTMSLSLSSAGVPTFSGDDVDLNAVRVERMLWCAAEDRKGVSWSRSFAATAQAPGVKVTVKPRSVKGETRTLAVTYVEDGGVRGEGTVDVAGPKRIVSGAKLTLAPVKLPFGDSPLTVTVTQKTIRELANP